MIDIYSSVIGTRDFAHSMTRLSSSSVIEGTSSLSEMIHHHLARTNSLARTLQNPIKAAVMMYMIASMKNFETFANIFPSVTVLIP